MPYHDLIMGFVVGFCGASVVLGILVSLLTLTGSKPREKPYAPSSDEEKIICQGQEYNLEQDYPNGRANLTRNNKTMWD